VRFGVILSCVRCNYYCSSALLKNFFKSSNDLIGTALGVSMLRGASATTRAGALATGFGMSCGLGAFTFFSSTFELLGNTNFGLLTAVLSSAGADTVTASKANKQVATSVNFIFVSWWLLCVLTVCVFVGYALALRQY